MVPSGGGTEWLALDVFDQSSFSLRCLPSGPLDQVKLDGLKERFSESSHCNSCFPAAQNDTNGRTARCWF
jgi:hypothetical protein